MAVDRRGFLRGLAGAVGGVLASQGAGKAAKPERTELQVSPVAGFQYHDAPKVWNDLKVGQPVALVREPNNEDDPRAVRVEWNGVMLGYLPRNENGAVCHQIDAGKTITGEVARLNADALPWDRIRVKVWIG